MSDFFAVGLSEFHQACSLGLNAAVSLLVLACGTGRDNQTTAWSANAVQNYGGISWKRAKPAIDALKAAGIVQQIDTASKKPRYKLRISDDLIWLSKSIIMPLAGETPPVMRIRQMQDVELLKLFIDLYFSHKLDADYGLSRLIYRVDYEKTKYCEHGQLVLFGFDQANRASTTSVFQAMFEGCSETSDGTHQVKEDDPEFPEFFRRMKTLIDLGLLEESVCLFESVDPTSELLFPVNGPTSNEKMVLEDINATVETLLPDWQVQNNPHEYLVPVYRHLQKVEMFGIFRLRHRPHTNATSAWWMSLQNKIDDVLRFLKQIKS